MRTHSFQEHRPLVMLAPGKILADPNQPRKTFSENSLTQLAESIRENGILQPLTVRKGKGGYLLISGERRWRAAQIVGLKKIPCIVVNTGEQTAAVMALVENLQREDLSCFEEAEGIDRLIRHHGLSREDAAARLGLANSTLSNKLRLLKLTPWQRERIVGAGLSERHARALLQIADDDLRNDVLLTVIAKQLTVAQTEQLIALGKQEAEDEPSPKRKTIIGDLRLFANTIQHAVSTMQKSGIEARSEKLENESFIQYTILIPKVPREEKLIELN